MRRISTSVTGMSKKDRLYRQMRRADNAWNKTWAKDCRLDGGRFKCATQHQSLDNRLTRKEHRIHHAERKLFNVVTWPEYMNRRDEEEAGLRSAQ